MNLSPRARLAAVLLAAWLPGACGADQDPYAVSTEVGAVEQPPASFRLDATALERAGVGTAPVGPADLARALALPGSIRFDEERRAALVARLDGVVAEVGVRLGDQVVPGDLLAVLHSRELARARSAFIEAAHRLEFARTAFEREEGLWRQAISPEEDYLRARHALSEARLELLTSGQELRALGVEPGELEQLARLEDLHSEDGVDRELTRFELRAPIGGAVVTRSCVLGQSVAANTLLFEVADLTGVWVDLRVRAADLFGLSVGQPVTVVSRDLGREVDATIAYLDPRVDADTQTALARIALPNEGGAWRPGLFVTVRASSDRRAVAVAVPLEALHSVGGGELVFVALGAGRFEAREVELGARDARHAEVLSGLRAGEEVATTNGLLLKSAWLGQGGEEE